MGPIRAPLRYLLKTFRLTAIRSLKHYWLDALVLRGIRTSLPVNITIPVDELAQAVLAQLRFPSDKRNRWYAGRLRSREHKCAGAKPVKPIFRMVRSQSEADR
jgi:hypothetical protein